MEEVSTKLKAFIDDREVTIDVKNIIKSDVTNKEYMFYTIDKIVEEEDKLFVSLMNESEQGLILEETIDEADYELISKATKEIIGE